MTHFRTRAVHAGQPPDASSGALATPIVPSTAFGYGSLERGAALLQARSVATATAALPAHGGGAGGQDGRPGRRQYRCGLCQRRRPRPACCWRWRAPVTKSPFWGATLRGHRNLFRDWASALGHPRGRRHRLRAARRAHPNHAPGVGGGASPTPACNCDLAGVAAIARAHGRRHRIDNNFRHFILLRPLARYRPALHPATKHLGGTATLPAASSRVCRWWRPYARPGWGRWAATWRHTRPMFLRGIRPCRYAWPHIAKAPTPSWRIWRSTLRCAPQYPGLPTHPSMPLAQRLNGGGFGMVTFELARCERRRCRRRVEPPATLHQAVSLGDVDSLACRRPAQFTPQLCQCRGTRPQRRDRGPDPPERGYRAPGRSGDRPGASAARGVAARDASAQQECVCGFRAEAL